MPKDTFRNLPAEKRARILSAACREFAQHPPHRASVNRLVKAAGIAKGSFYQYFDDMVDVYRHLVLEVGAERKLAAIKAAGPPPDGADFFATLAHFGLQGLLFGVREPELAAAAAHLTRPSPDPELRAMQEETDRRSHSGLRAMLQAGQAAGAVRTDLHLDTAVVLTATVIRQGLSEVFRHRYGLDTLALVADPQAGERVSVEALRDVVDAVIGFLRHAIGTSADTCGDIDLDQIALGFRRDPGVTNSYKG